MTQSASPGPLAGIKVLELGTLIAGPFCARMLAEFGAEVIKIETPGSGDPIRQWRVLKDGTSLWWSVQARNKKSLTLNLKDARGRAIARQLALEADIIIENYRPGVLEKWELGYAQLQAVKPATIMVRLSGFGQTGPMRTCPASAPSASRWAGCATCPATPTGRRCGSACRSATRWRRCTG
ncbi:CoA transferase [Rugamonas sp. DEMB1]|nr:CoA transferase [Rugamonas sp. DEMB1]WGG48977.1 CoA transferase [Rugamonas sp. DEMB1]